MKKIAKFIWTVLRILYFPIYVISFIAHKIARLLLALTYAGMLETQLAKDTFKFVFTKPSSNVK